MNQVNSCDYNPGVMDIKGRRGEKHDLPVALELIFHIQSLRRALKSDTSPANIKYDFCIEKLVISAFDSLEVSGGSDYKRN